MEHSWEFRDVTDTERVVNAAECAMRVEVDDAVLVGPQEGWIVRFIQVVPNEEEGGVTMLVYVERPLKVTSTVLADGRVVEW